MNVQQAIQYMTMNVQQNEFVCATGPDKDSPVILLGKFLLNNTEHIIFSSRMYEDAKAVYDMYITDSLGQFVCHSRKTPRSQIVRSQELFSSIVKAVLPKYPEHVSDPSMETIELTEEMDALEMDCIRKRETADSHRKTAIQCVLAYRIIRSYNENFIAEVKSILLELGKQYKPDSECVGQDITESGNNLKQLFQKYLSSIPDNSLTPIVQACLEKPDLLLQQINQHQAIENVCREIFQKFDVFEQALSLQKSVH
jgi:hypothetical protein